VDPISSVHASPYLLVGILKLADFHGKSLLSKMRVKITLPVIIGRA